MQFTIFATALLVTVASAANIVGYTGSNCGGTSIACNGISQNVCCNFGTIVRAIRWTLPSNSRGIGYTGNSCTATAFQPVFGPRNGYCFNYTPSVRSAKWVVGTAVKREPDAPNDCMKPNQYSFVNSKGETIVRDILKEDADKILGYIANGEYDKLEL